MRKPRTRTLIATAAVAAATATTRLMIASTAGASTTTTAEHADRCHRASRHVAVRHREPVNDRGRPA